MSGRPPFASQQSAGQQPSPYRTGLPGPASYGQSSYGQQYGQQTQYMQYGAAAQQQQQGGRGQAQDRNLPNDYKNSAFGEF